MINFSHNRFNVILLFCSLFLIFRFSSSANVQDMNLEMGPTFNPEPGIIHVNFDISQAVENELARIDLALENSKVQANQMVYGFCINFGLFFPVFLWDHIGIDLIVYRIFSSIVIFLCFPFYLGYFMSISWHQNSLCPLNFEFKRLRVEPYGLKVSKIKWASLAVTWIMEFFCFMPDYAYNSLSIVPPRLFFYISLAILFAYIIIPVSFLNRCFPMRPILPE